MTTPSATLRSDTIASRQQSVLLDMSLQTSARLWQTRKQLSTTRDLDKGICPLSHGQGRARELLCIFAAKLRLRLRDHNLLSERSAALELC